jgi:hypothetical protein
MHANIIVVSHLVSYNAAFNILFLTAYAISMKERGALCHRTVPEKTSRPGLPNRAVTSQQQTSQKGKHRVAARLPLVFIIIVCLWLVKYFFAGTEMLLN